MALTRRALIQDSTGVAGLAALLAHPGVAEALSTVLDENQPDFAAGNAAAFWGSFLVQPHGRGIFPHKGAGSDPDRQVNFLHYKETNDNTELRYADQIQPNELLDYPGDVSASIKLGGVRLSSEDRAKFEQVRSAQLRIDLLQGQSMYSLIDPLAWMALAGIMPEKGGKLPPLQNLSWDPASSMQNMQKIVLPGGFGHLAVNVSMLPRENPFFHVLNGLAQDTAQIAPILGLPAISVTALVGFSKLYGLLENRTTFLFQAKPTMACATQQARKTQDSTIGINMPAGDYVLVPQTYTDELKPYLGQLKLVNGYLVDKDAAAKNTSSSYELAESAKPDISYLTLNVGIKPLVQGPFGSANANSSSGDSSDTESSKRKKK